MRDTIRKKKFITIPNIFARQWIAPGRRRKLERLIEERKAKGKFVEPAIVEANA